MVYIKYLKKKNLFYLIIGDYNSTCITIVNEDFVNETEKNFKCLVTYNDDDIMVIKLMAG